MWNDPPDMTLKDLNPRQGITTKQLVCVRCVTV